ncbi:MAG: GH116 family glycosyl hydrolase [Ginsengibacter sp.]
MIYRSFLALCLAIFSFSGNAQPPANKAAIRIAIVSDHIDKGELSAIEKLLQSETGWTYDLLSIKEIRNKKALNGFTHIWYHRTDTAAFDKDEIAAGTIIANFVRAGGDLFLSMEAVPLLNSWGIEKAPFQTRQDTLVDEGFGRPAGFHAFKSHPLFSGLNGGVYTSKQKKDHVVRKHGFFDQSVPNDGKVAGIQWTYITFTEQNKLLLEYNYGKGTIIAAGAYLYYNSDNYNGQQLYRFTKNVFEYTVGQIKNIKKEYWHYEKPTMSAASFSLTAIQPVAAAIWDLPAPTLQMKQPVATKNFYDLVGRRILWMGALNGGVDEIWMHPYMALRDLTLGVKIMGTDSVSWLKNIPSEVEITPEYLVRTYKIKNTSIREIYTVSFDKPNGVAHLEIDGNDVKELAVKYASNLRYMWPYSHEATGSIKYAFSPAINGHIISGQQGTLNTVVTYSAKPLQQKIWAVDSLSQVKVRVNFLVRNKSALNIYIMGSSESVTDAAQLFDDNKQNMSRLFERSNQYYTNLLKTHLHFITPDTLFNNGYQWALARTDQFLQTTPGIGTALMAGFGTTARGWNGAQKISGRPGYAWYFGRDAEWSAMAINAYGDFAMVKEQLETFIRFQDINGKIYHELSSSGAVHYDASDATPLFVVLAAHYLKYSGDSAYIRHRWPEIKKAMDFCYSTDTDNDGLIENTNVGHGWIEGGSLFGTHTEFYLAGSWAAALDGAAYMAKRIGIKGSTQYATDAAKVKKIIDRDFWNEKQQFFYNGKMKDGTYMPDATVLAAVPVYLNAIVDSHKEEQVSNRLGTNYFSTDWGIRIIEDSSKKYRPNSYHAGMVWPLYGGWAALAEYKTGNYRSGFQHIMNNLLQYRNWSPGSAEETLNGDVFTPNGVCSHQAWSETMILQPAIEGMLGLKPDAMENRLQLSPCFPWDWQFCTVKNIRMKNDLFNLDMKKRTNGTTFIINGNHSASIDFNPVFPLHTTFKSVKINGESINFHVLSKSEGAVLHLSFKSKAGDNIIEVETAGGIGILPVISMPVPGDQSKGIQVVAENISAKTYSVEASGKPGAVYELQLYHKDAVKKVTGAWVLGEDGDIITLQVKMDNGANQKYIRQPIEVEFE